MSSDEYSDAFTDYSDDDFDELDAEVETSSEVKNSDEYLPTLYPYNSTRLQRR